MSGRDPSSLSDSNLNRFLFADIGPESNGMTLSVLSAFARLGSDPWGEAHRLAGLPRAEAADNLARTIAGMPASTWSLPDAAAIAARLIVLLPGRSGQGTAAKPERGPRGHHDGPSGGALPQSGRARYLRIGLLLACMALGTVFTVQALTDRGSTARDGSGVASFDSIPVPVTGSARH